MSGPIDLESSISEKYVEVLNILDGIILAIENEIAEREIIVPSLSEVYMAPFKREYRKNQNREIKALLKKLSRTKIEREIIYNQMNLHDSTE